MATGRVSNWALNLSLVLIFIVCCPYKYEWGVYNDATSLIVASKLDMKSYPSRNSGLARRSNSLVLPLSVKVKAGICLANRSLLAYFLILLANDVSLNPGPVLSNSTPTTTFVKRSLRPRCEMCMRVFKKAEGFITCTKCDLKYHLKCIGIQYESSRTCMLCSTGNTCDRNDISKDASENGEYPELAELTSMVNQRGFRILHLNVCSLISKLDEIRLLLKRYKGIHMFTVTETHLSSQIQNAEIAIEGYNIYRKDRKDQAKGGGVLVYLSNSMSAVRRLDLESDNVESIWLEIVFPKTKGILVGSIYRPPLGSKYLSPEFNFQLEESLDIAFAEGKEVIMLGDMNVNFTPHQRCLGDSKQLKEIFRNVNLTQIVKDSTRTTNNCKALIDIILTSHPQNMPLSTVIPLGLSDHDMIGCVRKMNSLKNKARIIKCRNYKRYCAESFNDELKRSPWNDVYVSDDVDSAWDKFKKIFLEVCDRHAPLISKKVRGSCTPWLNGKVSRIIHTRDYYLRKAKRSGSDNDWSIYRRYRNQATAAVRKAKSVYNRSLIQDNLDNPRNFWKTIKRILPSKNTISADSISQINSEGQILTDKTSIANAFCKFFSRVKLRIMEASITTRALHSLSSLYVVRRTNHVFELKTLPNDYIYNQLRQLKTSKATGLDGIPARLLKDAAFYISAPITHIINLSITTQRVPCQWKHAKVVPLYKDGKREDMDNYRPISILPVLSKLLERAVQSQLINYLEMNNLFPNCQHGFRRRHSTQSAITFFTDTIRKNMDNGLLTGAVFVDYRKAFDTIDHCKLLEKLKSFGIVGREHDWMSDYLSARSQSVFIDGVLSDAQPVLSGVPQGSILGPILFSLYITDLPDCFQTASTLMYADDTVIYVAASSISQLSALLNTELANLLKWSSANELCIHPKKTEYVVFGTSRRLNGSDSDDDLRQIMLGEQALERKSFFNYLGIYLDQSLTFQEHTSKLIKKISSQLGLLKRIRGNLTIQGAEIVYRSMILPKLDYCDFVWNQLPPSRYNALEYLQTRAARIILMKDDGQEELIHQLGWKTLQTRCFIHRVVFVFKCMNMIGPDIFNQYFVKSSHAYNTRRNNVDYLLPKVRTEAAKKGCFYVGVKDFNSLPVDIKKMTSLLLFKSALEKMF